MKIIYLIIGFIALSLGIIGIILPILPTTPFLLLTGFCFTRSSEKINRWFLSTRLYHKHLDSFVKERAMTLKSKIIILSFASFMLSFPLIFAQSLLVKTLIICLYVGKYYYFIFKIATVKERTYH